MAVSIWCHKWHSSTGGWVQSGVIDQSGVINGIVQIGAVNDKVQSWSGVRNDTVQSGVKNGIVQTGVIMV
jgi:hypothetical protein